MCATGFGNCLGQKTLTKISLLGRHFAFVFKELFYLQTYQIFLYHNSLMQVFLVLRANENENENKRNRKLNSSLLIE